MESEQMETEGKTSKIQQATFCVVFACRVVDFWLVFVPGKHRQTFSLLKVCSGLEDVGISGVTGTRLSAPMTVMTKRSVQNYAAQR